MKRLILENVELIAHRLARKVLEWNEPIPDFNSRYPGRLESALGAPFHTYEGKELYPGIDLKTAILFYSMVKNHPFENGNKRVALVSVFVFLSLNDYWLESTPEEMYHIATSVASSPRDIREKNIEMLKEFISNRLKKASEI